MRAVEDRKPHHSFAVTMDCEGVVMVTRSVSVCKVMARSAKQAIRKARSGDSSSQTASSYWAVIKTPSGDVIAVKVKWVSIAVSETPDQALWATLKFIKNGNHHV